MSVVQERSHQLILEQAFETAVSRNGLESMKGYFYSAYVGEPNLLLLAIQDGID